jgi:hypothetical protein
MPRWAADHWSFLACQLATPMHNRAAPATRLISRASGAVDSIPSKSLNTISGNHRSPTPAPVSTIAVTIQNTLAGVMSLHRVSQFGQGEQAEYPEQESGYPALGGTP